MSSCMATRAQRDAIPDFVAEVWARSPRLQVVSVKSPSSLGTVLTRPVVAIQDGSAEGSVLGTFEVRLPELGLSSLPVPVRGANEMLVGRWTHPLRSDGFANLGAMLRCQLPTLQSLRDVPLSLLTMGTSHA